MEIPGELKKETPSEVQRQSRNVQQSLKTPWINKSFEA
jgi:hypothetical protein